MHDDDLTLILPSKHDNLFSQDAFIEEFSDINEPSVDEDMNDVDEEAFYAFEQSRLLEESIPSQPNNSLETVDIYDRNSEVEMLNRSNNLMEDAANMDSESFFMHSYDTNDNQH